MKTLPLIFRVLLIYTVIIFAVCVGLSFTVLREDITLIDGQAQYAFAQSLLLFFKYLPAVLLSGSVVGFSWAFGKLNIGNPGRFSSQLFSLLKTVYISGLACTLAIFAASEVGVPSVQRSIRAITEKTKNYAEYYQLARKYYVERNFTSADFYVKTALSFYPGSAEALQLDAEIEKKHAEENISDAGSSAELKNTAKLKGGTVYSVRELVFLADQAFKESDYINAHYYAGLALNAVKTNDSNYTRARKLSADAWNKIEQISGSEETEQEKAFAQKKRGYISLERGDILNAYYTFSDLNERYPSDLDTQQYLETAKKLVETQYFYIDESADLKQFEQYKYVYFCINRPDGTRNVVYAAGITSIKKAGNMIQYLRDFSVASYDADGRITSKFDVPYAKMTAMPSSNFGYLDEFLNTDYKKTMFVPYILLTGIDRKTEGVVSTPVYYAAEKKDDGVQGTAGALVEVPNGPGQFLLPIDYSVFLTICDAVHGADEMPLLSLLKFAPKASDAGFSNEVYLQAILYRVTYPLILMIVYVLCGMLGWNYRMSYGQLFKFVWIFILPVFTVVAHFLMETLRFLEKLIYFPLLSALGASALPAAIGVLIAVLISVSVLFSGMRGE